MREIKFRAWDGEIMQPLFAINSLSGKVVFNGEVKDWPLMQFTGLKDKNGVDIYEGDIVLIDWLEGDDSHFDKVEWSDSDACFDFGAGTTSEVNWSHMVIGNIYENPELLVNKNEK